VAINDWYEAHYLSICRGEWYNHNASLGKNDHTAVCMLQTAGYTFSIADLVGDNSQRSILSSHHTLDTKAPFILLVLSIVSMGVAIVGFLYGIFVMAKSCHKGRMVKRDLPLFVLRVAFFASIASIILKTISSAKITASADENAGKFELEGGNIVNAWTHSAFLAVTWIGTGIVWVGFGLVLAAAFRIAAVLKEDGHMPDHAGRRWYRV
jgi:hypothetical protein